MPDLKQLVVHINGLCMLVQRTRTRPGLYVLMPVAAHHRSPHCPLFVAAAEFGDGIQFRRLKMESMEDEIDLSNIADHQTPAPIDFIANVSKFYSDQPSRRPRVDKDCLDSGRRPGLAARIRLPLAGPGQIKPVGPLAEFLVPSGIPGHFNAARLAGRCKITYDVKPDHGWIQRINGAELNTNANGVIEIHFVNTRVKDLVPHAYYHEAGDAWSHPQAYHVLLKKSGSPDLDANGPRALYAMTVQGNRDVDDHRTCDDVQIQTWPPDALGSGGPMFGDDVAGTRSFAVSIDPYNCTVGGGCPPEEDC